MSSNRKFKTAPIALTTTTTTNLLNPAAATGGVNGGSAGQVITLTHIHVTNKTTGAVFFGLWLGATGANAAGSEFVAGAGASAGAITANTGISVAANGTYDWFGSVPLTTSDFVVGGASATGLTIQFEGEVGL